MRRVAAVLAGHFVICGLAVAAAQDLPYTQSRINDASLGTTFLQNSGWHFAYQGFAGLEIPVARGAAQQATYRWMHTDNVTAKCGAAGAPTLTCTNIGFDDQSVDLGLKIDLQ
jgi:hypothetical protein